MENVTFHDVEPSCVHDDLSVQRYHHVQRVWVVGEAQDAPLSRGDGLGVDHEPDVVDVEPALVAEGLQRGLLVVPAGVVVEQAIKPGEDLKKQLQ